VRKQRKKGQFSINQLLYRFNKESFINIRPEKPFLCVCANNKTNVLILTIFLANRPQKNKCQNKILDIDCIIFSKNHKEIVLGL